MSAQFKHDRSFDPTGGFSPEQLRQPPVMPDEPGDFEAFWRATFREAMAAPLEWRLRPSAMPVRPDYKLLDLEFAGLLGNRVGGWLARPRGRPARRGVVVTHGYTGRDAPLIEDLWEDAAMIFPVCTGLPARSLHAGIPSHSEGHVLHGIGRRETYVHRYCVMDVWRAVSVLLEAVPEVGPQVDYHGGSFGGGIGAMALPWDARFRKAHLGVPSFGHHPLRLGLPCGGSGEAVRRYAQTHPGVRDVLAYFDAAIAARHVRIPVHVAAALFDPAVPPAGQFAVAHALAGETWIFELEAGHFEHDGSSREAAAMQVDLCKFFA
ncbi:MAG: deacetylase [Rariglobus sp.]|nr:deacetylase [Rariglobus sp.]